MFSQWAQIRPVRIDFFDDEVESLRCFAAETQLSGDHVDSIDILPAREVPLDAEAVREFRHHYRERFEGQPGKSRVYREVSDGIAHGGIEYYLPLFFESTASFGRLPAGRLCRARPGRPRSIVRTVLGRGDTNATSFAALIKERPILSVEETFTAPEAIPATGEVPRHSLHGAIAGTAPGNLNLDTRLPPAMKIEARYEDALPPSCVSRRI